MPASVPIHLFRHRAKQPRLASTYGLGFGLFISLVLALVSLVTPVLYATLTHELPAASTLAVLLDPPDGLLRQPTQIYDQSGQVLLAVLRNPAAAQAEYLNYSSFPPILVQAFLAVNDPGFWEHPIFSLSGLADESSPTLTEQLVEELLLGDETPGLRRKLRAHLLAAQVTARFGREKIIEWYLNRAYFGQLAYGVDAAAWLYLDKSATDVNLAEAALLAAISESPALNPLDAPQAALERQRAVVSLLQQTGQITLEEAQAAYQTTLILRPATPQLLEPDSLAPVFTRLVIEQLTEQLGRQRVEQGGLRIITTLDFNLQFQATCAAATQTARLGGKTPPIQTLPGYTCQADRLLPSFPIQKESPGIGPSPNYAANLVALDPATGYVLSMVGDADAPALTSQRPGGSLVTPFVYLAGLTRGMSPATLVWDTPDGLSQTSLLEEDESFHGPMRLRQALANDYLAPAIKTLEQVGVESTWRIVRQIGLADTPADGENSVSPLEEMSLTLLEATQAFGVFSYNGLLVGQLTQTDPTSTPAPGELPPLSPITILRVEDLAGRLVWQSPAPQTRPVITPQLAYLMSHMLSDEPARWASLGHPNPLEIGRSAAAKLGRTPGGQENWTVGYTPGLVVGVWVGRSSSIPDSLPYYASAGLWHAVLQYATRDQPYQDWLIPAGINTQTVCAASGLLPTPDCPAVVDEPFIQGTEPTRVDTLFRSLPVNRATGNLATVFTPLHLVDEKVFLNIPYAAQEWARQAGLEIQPQDYDILSLPSVTPDVNLTQPKMFAAVRGQVEIRGSASGEDFASYRVQVGSGLNPSQWFLIGKTEERAVQNGLLATWDTSQLVGLHAIQLLVTRKDGRMQTHTLLVTVDNEPPALRILYPLADQTVLPGPNKVVTLQVHAIDNQVLQRVDIYIDNKLAASLSQLPYAWSWQSRPGKHELKVVATDGAGNTRQESVHFLVGSTGN